MASRHPSRKGLHRSPFVPCFLILLAIAAYLLLSEHRAHFLGSLPMIALLLLCPLMHIFMHRGHHHHHDRRKGTEDADEDEEKP